VGELQLCAVLIDGTPFKDRQMTVALGIGCDGRKTVLGIREGATENTARGVQPVNFSLLRCRVPRWESLDSDTRRPFELDRRSPCALSNHAGPSSLRGTLSKWRDIIQDWFLHRAI
jgi:hypothetical protein